MQRIENYDIAYKEIYVPEVKKDIIAFTSTDGGTVVGVENPDSIMLQVASALKDSVKPDIMPFIKIQSNDENSILEYLAQKGSITRRETEELTQLGSTSSYIILKNLCDAGKIKSVGSGKTTKYILL